MLLTVSGGLLLRKEKVLHSPPAHQSRQTSLVTGRRHPCGAWELTSRIQHRFQNLSEALVLAQGLYDPPKERSLADSGVTDYRKEGAKTKVEAVTFIALERDTRIRSSLAHWPAALAGLQAFARVC